MLLTGRFQEQEAKQLTAGTSEGSLHRLSVQYRMATTHISPNCAFKIGWFPSACPPACVNLSSCNGGFLIIPTASNLQASQSTQLHLHPRPAYFLKGFHQR
ncbi:hypothetical protein Mapa_013593 [Marchantia paleacea]|nr:hypothetical protein Mapa_013593 [Marchantia paleacea]